MMTYILPNFTPTISRRTHNNLAEAFVPVKTGKGDNHSVFILDDSASMRRTKASTISGYNEYLKSQKIDAKNSDKKTFVSLYKFDGYNVTCVLNRQNIKKAKKLNSDTYQANGMATNLHDAIGSVLSTINNKMSKYSKKHRDAVIVTILTDGGENSSKLFSANTIKIMVETAESKDWGFMFLGANINAFITGSALGFGVNNTIQYTMNNIKESINMASDMTTRVRGSLSKGMSTTSAYAVSGFTTTERASATKND